MPQLFGLLNVDKPRGMTSRKVVDHVARGVKPAKAGHAGTLDPLATGVLVVCVGPATRLISYVQQQRKTYRAKFLLGRRSDTDDITGEVESVDVAEPVRRGQLDQLLPEFVGRIEQVPPRFSAVHVGGRRAYDLAREGKPVDLAPRTVDVYTLQVVELEYPELQLDIECGSGTYIRAIGRDIGERLGCGAVMSELVRTRIGPFDISSAVTLEELTRESLRRMLLPAATAVSHLPQRTATDEELRLIRNGRPIPCGIEPGDEMEIAVLTPDGQLACLGQRHGEWLQPRHVFVR